VPLLVEFIQVGHRAATMAPRRECVTERVPIGHILESPESRDVIGGSSPVEPDPLSPLRTLT